MVEDDSCIAGADATRRLNKRLLLKYQRIPSHQTGEGRNGEDCDSNDDVSNATSQHRHHRNCQQNTRKGEQHIADAHNQPIPPAFVIARHQSQYRPYRRANKDGKDSRSQRDLRTDQHAAENISTQ